MPAMMLCAIAGLNHGVTVIWAASHPWAVLAPVFGATGGASAFVAALLQYPVYGAVLQWGVWTRHSTSASAVVIIAHLSGAILAWPHATVRLS